MFTIEERHGTVYAMYDFTLDELEWLLSLVPHKDGFARDIQQGIIQLKQAEFDKAEALESGK